MTIAVIGDEEVIRLKRLNYSQGSCYYYFYFLHYSPGSCWDGLGISLLSREQDVSASSLAGTPGDATCYYVDKQKQVNIDVVNKII